MVCGIDIVQISRMEDLVTHHERSLHRFFTDREIAYCRQRQYHQYALLPKKHCLKPWVPDLDRENGRMWKLTIRNWGHRFFGCMGIIRRL